MRLLSMQKSSGSFVVTRDIDNELRSAKREWRSRSMDVPKNIGTHGTSNVLILWSMGSPFTRFKVA